MSSSLRRAQPRHLLCMCHCGKTNSSEARSTQKDPVRPFSFQCLVSPDQILMRKNHLQIVRDCATSRDRTILTHHALNKRITKNKTTSPINTPSTGQRNKACSCLQKKKQPESIDFDRCCGDEHNFFFSFRKCNHLTA